MAQRKIKHRLGEIQFDYSDTAKWSATDQRLADLLAKTLLCSESNLLNTEALGKRTAKLHKWIVQTQTAFEETGKALEAAQEIAGGYVGAIELGQYSIAHTLSDAVNFASKKLQAQSKNIRGMHPNYSQLVTDHNLMQEQHDEDLEQAYQELSAFELDAFGEETIATDMLSFDKAVEKLKALVSVNSRAEEQLFNRTLEVIADYNLLSAKIEGQQNVWKEFCYRMVLIEYIGKMRNDNKGISFN